MDFKALFERKMKDLVYSGTIVNPSFATEGEDLKDEEDGTQTELEQSMRLRLRSREALYLKKIDDALRRISAGTFGKCEDCGENIDARRLEARPTATLCVGCKEEEERREVLHADGMQSKSLGRKLRLTG